MIDAVLVSPQRMESLPWLSLEAPMRRGHGSIYQALERGGCDPTTLADLFSGVLTGFTEPGLPLVFSLDCTHWPRRDAATSPDRTFNYDASKTATETTAPRSPRAGATNGWSRPPGDIPPGS